MTVSNCQWAVEKSSGWVGKLGRYAKLLFSKYNIVACARWVCYMHWAESTFLTEAKITWPFHSFLTGSHTNFTEMKVHDKWLNSFVTVEKWQFLSASRKLYLLSYWVVTFLIRLKSGSTRVFKILPHVTDPQVVKYWSLHCSLPHSPIAHV